MGLSNTAVPRYYGEFRDKVLRGEIPVNEQVSLEMNRIDEMIANPLFYYDSGAIDGFIKYCENELTLTDGSDVRMLPTFKLWAESLLSWFYFEDRSVYVPTPDNHGGHFERKMIKLRLVNKQYLIVARGAAKSMYAMFLQAFFLNVDTSTTHQVTTAPTMKQAEEVMQPFRTAITRARGPLFKFLTQGSPQNTTGNRADRQKLVSTKKGIENFLTNSLLEIRPMRTDKLQGLRTKYNTIDEWLSGDVRENVITALEQGASKEDNWIIIAMSSEGTVRNGAGDDIKIELGKILKGEYYDPHTSIWHYRLDSVEEVSNPAMWPKAQPNLGLTVSWDTYQRDYERMNNVPSARNDILAKRFGIPMEGYTWFFTYEETLPHARTADFWKLPCAMGADLSQGDDFCAFTFLFPLPGGGFGVKTRSYISELTQKKLPGSARAKYQEFIDEGTLFVMPGVALDMMEVYEDVDEYITRNQYDVRAFGYDPYNARTFVERWIRENGEYAVEKVIQGVKSESVPLGELKKYASERQLIFDQKLMQFAMGNTVTLEDTNGNRKIYKKRQDAKIDNVAALMDAYIAWNLNREAFE